MNSQLMFFDRKKFEQNSKSKTAEALSYTQLCEAVLTFLPQAASDNHQITTFFDESRNIHLGVRMNDAWNLGYGTVNVMLKLHSEHFDGDNRSEKVIGISTYQKPFSARYYRLLSGEEAYMEFRVMKFVAKNVNEFLTQLLKSGKATQEEVERLISYLGSNWNLLQNA